MSLLNLIVPVIALIASTEASGFGHFAAVKSFPIVRYAPFYNFPNTVRSIHAIAPAVPAFAPAPAPVLPAPVAPAFPAPALPAPVFSAPVPAPAFAPVPAAPAPLLPAPLSAPVFPVPAFAPSLPALAPAFPVLPKLAPTYPILPRIVPVTPSLHTLPFSPIVRPVAPAPVYAPAPAPAPVFAPAPVVAPAPVAIARAVPVPEHLHLYNRFIPAPVAPAPFVKQVAW